MRLDIEGEITGWVSNERGEKENHLQSGWGYVSAHLEDGVPGLGYAVNTPHGDHKSSKDRIVGFPFQMAELHGLWG